MLVINYIFYCVATPSGLRPSPPIRGEISSLIGEGDHEVVERFLSLIGELPHRIAG